MIQFTCPVCNRMLSVEDEFAGKRGTCPHCKTAVLISEATLATAARRPLAPSGAGSNTVPLGATKAASPMGPGPQAPELDAPQLGFLAPAQDPQELGRLGPYPVL